MTLTYCISLIEEAKSVLSNALTESDFQTVSTAYENEPVIVFIDIDYARYLHLHRVRSELSRSVQFNGVRKNLLEAVKLFAKAGGQIIALTSRLEMVNMDYEMSDNDFFSQIIYEPDFDVNKKAIQIINDAFIRIGFRKYVFGNNELVERLQNNVRPGDLIINIDETEILELYELFDDHNDRLQNYTPIEYILFYLTMKLQLQSFGSE